MPILTAIGHNPWQRTYYQRLIARGKPPKLAIVASMRKLVTAIYSVAKSRTPFVSRDAREAFPPRLEEPPGGEGLRDDGRRPILSGRLPLLPGLPYAEGPVYQATPDLVTLSISAAVLKEEAVAEK